MERRKKEVGSRKWKVQKQKIEGKGSEQEKIKQISLVMSLVCADQGLNFIEIRDSGYLPESFCLHW